MATFEMLDFIMISPANKLSTSRNWPIFKHYVWNGDGNGEDDDDDVQYRWGAVQQ